MNIRAAKEYELPVVALLLRDLHKKEQAPASEITGTYAGLLAYLVQAEDTVIFVAVSDHVIGCLLIRFLAILGKESATAEGFTVRPGAPKEAAWRLMKAGADEIENRRVVDVFIMTSRRTKPQRSAYRAMGFREIGEEGERIFHQAKTADIQAALAKRLARFT